MNKQELNEAFSRLRASDGLFTDVCGLEKEQKNDSWRMVRRVVACAAVLAILLTALLWPNTEESYITGPGVLVVRAYEAEAPTLSEEYSKILEEGITLPPEYTWVPNMSLICPATLGLPLSFSIPEDTYVGMEITFEIWVSGGDFEHLDYYYEFSDYFLGRDDSVDSYDISKARYFGGHFTIPNNKTIYWRSTGHVFDDINREMHYIELDSDQVFVDVIVRADNYIVGYAVIEIRDVGHEKKFTYNTRMLKSVSFPQIDGHFQKVSEKYVKEQIELIHNDA